MYDFHITESTVGTGLFCLIIYMYILVNNYKKAFKYPYKYSISEKTKRRTVFLAGFFIVIFCKKGDFFHLMETVHTYDFTLGAYNYGEEIYLELGRLLNKNYFLFRIVVWGGAFSLFYWTAKRLDVPIYYSVMLLFCSYVVLFAYARATAAMAVYFFGLSFLCKPIKNYKWFSYVIGLLIIYLSWEFHNSAIIMILSTILLFLPIKKWSILLIFICLPTIVIVAKDYFYMVADFAIESDSAVGERMLRYSESARESPISQSILRFFKYLSFYIPLIISTIAIFIQNKEKDVPTPIIRMYKVTFGLVLIASVIYLFGNSFYVMFYRVLFMSMIPLCLIITSLYNKNFITYKQFKWCYMPGLIFCLLDIIYDIYAIYTTL